MTKKTSNNSDEPKKPRAGTMAARNPIVSDENWREKMKRRASLKFDDEKKAIFLEHLIKTGAKMLSAEAADITVTTINKHLENDPDFALQYDEALQIRSRTIVERLEREALEGGIRKRYDKEGNLISEEVVYETPLRAMLLKRHDNEYRDKQDINLSGGGGGVLVVPAGVSMEEYLKECEAQRQKMLSDQAARADKT